MFAVIRTGGKQYKVAKNDVISVEKLPGEAGETIALDQVLMLGDGEATKVGAPLVEGARVEATIVEQTRGPKIIVFKKKRRKNYRRKKGHRQDLTVVRVTGIVDADAKPAKPKKPATAKKTARAKTAAAKKTAKVSAKRETQTASPKAKKSAKTKAAKDDNAKEKA